MADEFQTTGNWWDSSRTRFEAAAGTSPSSSAHLSSLQGSFGWSTDHNTMVDLKSRSSMDSTSVSGSSPVIFHDSQKLQTSDSAAAGDPNLHMMGLGLSSQAMEWNQAALFSSRGEKAGEQSSFRSILQENMNSSNANSFQQWRSSSSSSTDHHHKLFPGDSSSEFKQMHNNNNNNNNNRSGFSLDHQFSPQYSSGADSTVTCQGFPVDSAAALYGSPSAILQGLFGPDSSTNQYNSANYGINSNEVLSSNNSVTNSWSNTSTKLPPFLRTSPPKQAAAAPPHQQPNYNHLHFSNNAPFWNASEAAAAATAVKDVRASFFSTLQPQFPTSMGATNFEEKPKNISEVRDQSGNIAVVKKSGNEASSNKRPRNDQTTSPLPAFKVRKEKMGDRITALQQLVSPFGKTDTASVLSEAIEYIKFLHEQVTVLSTPYMKSGAAIQHQQNNSDHKSKDPEDPKQDLRSRGLCLVPVSSTFPVTHETTVDFWTPTFGGTFR